MAPQGTHKEPHKEPHKESRKGTRKEARKGTGAPRSSRIKKSHVKGYPKAIANTVQPEHVGLVKPVQLRVVEHVEYRRSHARRLAGSPRSSFIG